MEQKIIKSQSYGLDVIQIEYMLTMQSDIVQENIMKAKEARVVPYLIGSAFDNLKPTFHFHEECTLDATPKNYKIIVNGENVNLEFKNSKKAVVNVLCR